MKKKKKNDKNMSTFLLEKFNEIEKKHWWWEGRRELIKLLLAKEKPKKILDVGCGTGETLSFIKTLYPKAKLYGVDASSKAIKFSKSRGHKNIFKTKAKKLPFKDETFDVVLYLDVLEHIKNDQEALDEATRVLKKNGSVIITSPALSFIWSEHDTRQGHQRRYTRRAIRKLAKGSKLKVRFISYFNFFLSPPIIIIRLLGNIPKFKKISSYDNGLNYDIAKKRVINSLLRFIFVTEIKILNYLSYPLGISIVAELKK